MSPTSKRLQKGPSKRRACVKCVQGKRACDEIRPTCERCAHLNKNCTYEDQISSVLDIAFVLPDAAIAQQQTLSNRSSDSRRTARWHVAEAETRSRLSGTEFTKVCTAQGWLHCPSAANSSYPLSGPECSAAAMDLFVQRQVYQRCPEIRSATYLHGNLALGRKTVEKLPAIVLDRV